MKQPSGILNLYKPPHKTSAKVIEMLKKKFKIKKIGFIGILDKFAEGVLPVPVNKATKIVKFLENDDKEYIATIKFGITTDTLDIYGEIVREEQFKLDIPQLLTTLQSFIGEIEQIPPVYSAVKIHGERASDKIRRGEKVALRPKKVRIYNILPLNINEKENTVELRIHCSKGTYIRALARDVAEKLGTVGMVEKLIRIRSGIFKIEDSFHFDSILKLEKIEELPLVPVKKIFELKYPKLVIKDDYKKFLLNGGILKRFYFFDYGNSWENGVYRVVDLNENLLAIIEFNNERFKYLKVFKN